jgi:hypothetical protein
MSPRQTYLVPVAVPAILSRSSALRPPRMPDSILQTQFPSPSSLPGNVNELRPGSFRESLSDAISFSGTTELRHDACRRSHHNAEQRH